MLAMLNQTTVGKPGTKSERWLVASGFSSNLQRLSEQEKTHERMAMEDKLAEFHVNERREDSAWRGKFQTSTYENSCAFSVHPSKAQQFVAGMVTCWVLGDARLPDRGGKLQHSTVAQQLALGEMDITELDKVVGPCVAVVYDAAHCSVAVAANKTGGTLPLYYGVTPEGALLFTSDAALCNSTYWDKAAKKKVTRVAKPFPEECVFIAGGGADSMLLSLKEGLPAAKPGHPTDKHGRVLTAGQRMQSVEGRPLLQGEDSSVVKTFKGAKLSRSVSGADNRGMASWSRKLRAPGFSAVLEEAVVAA